MSSWYLELGVLTLSREGRPHTDSGGEMEGSVLWQVLKEEICVARGELKSNYSVWRILMIICFVVWDVVVSSPHNEEVGVKTYTYHHTTIGGRPLMKKSPAWR